MAHDPLFFTRVDQFAIEVHLSKTIGASSDENVIMYGKLLALLHRSGHRLQHSVRTSAIEPSSLPIAIHPAFRPFPSLSSCIPHSTCFIVATRTSLQSRMASFQYSAKLGTIARAQPLVQTVIATTTCSRGSPVARLSPGSADAQERSKYEHARKPMGCLSLRHGHHAHSHDAKVAACLSMLCDGEHRRPTEPTNGGGWA